ncbi:MULTISPECIES: hypothetical protein [Pyrobaculum]|uniref:hypothetical protein n=1 Tax=Pyrobaculum TaxID=2276 RepID=UPI0010084E4A|nr:hypothetical protein [Pyrobaculum arsenaticum]MCY0890424.1 hypothetical protein [Pyrobaculum arsenaticum]
MCVVYGREGYHALFLKPLARLLGCVYAELDYMSLYRAYRRGNPGLYYIEDVWFRGGVAPDPRRPVPRALEPLRGKMYPVLGNVQVFYTDGRWGTASEAPCGRIGLLAKAGEPLVTDLFLPLYLETCDVAKALALAKEFYKCGLPSTPSELVQGIRSGQYAAAYLWLGWAPDLRLRPNPALGRAVAGFWGLTAIGVEVQLPDFYAYPPPYLDAQWRPYEHNKRLVESAVAVRGPGWMDYVEMAYPVIEAFLNGAVGVDKAARALGERLRGALHEGEGLF